LKYFNHYMNTLVAREFRRFSFSGPVLEVGCGLGETMADLGRWGYECVGIDLSAEAVQSAREAGLNTIHSDPYRFEQGPFPSVVCCDVVEHQQDDRKFVRRLFELTAPGGKVFLLVPSGRFWKDDIAFGHYRRYSRAEIASVAANAGFHVLATRSYGFPFLTFFRVLLNIWMQTPPDGSRADRTLASGRRHPLDQHVLAKACLRLSNSLAFTVLLRLCDQLFSDGDSGFGVVCVAERPTFSPAS